MTLISQYPQLYSKIKGVIIIDILPIDYLKFSKKYLYVFFTQNILNKLLNL